jgi:hypothetical protein
VLDEYRTVRCWYVQRPFPLLMTFCRIPYARLCFEMCGVRLVPFEPANHHRHQQPNASVSDHLNVTTYVAMAPAQFPIGLATSLSSTDDGRLYGRNVIQLACNMLVTCLPTCKCRCVSCFGATHDTFTTLQFGTAVDMTMEHVLTRTGVHPTPFRHAARSRRASRHACSDCRVQPWQRSHEQDRNVVARAQAPVDIEEVRAADVSTIAIATTFTHTFGRSIPAEVLMWRDTCRRRTTSMRRWTRPQRS